MVQELVLTERKGRVAIITLNRPDVLNALSRDLIVQLNAALEVAETDPEVGVVILTGNDKAFAAGADIREMKDRTFDEVCADNFIDSWEYLAKIQKPVIAAVSGYALGGGCELAMMCDIIVAAESAQFGLPEVTIGTMPGAGGTQRLTRLIGKTKAMEMCLTGRKMNAVEAQNCGLVTHVFPQGRLQKETLMIATKIASYSQPILQMIKEAVRAAETLPLDQGIRLERHLFQRTFTLKDHAEGMAAFLEKRPPLFRHE